MSNCVTTASVQPTLAPRRAFTLVELLVVIGIIALLMSILLPTLGRVRAQASSIKCSSQLKQIGNAVNIYMNTYKGYLAPRRNNARWQDPANSQEQIDPNHAEAYWGVAYAAVGGMPKTVFNCPSALVTSPGDYGDGTFTNGAIYVCYAINAYGVPVTNGFTDTDRRNTFGSADEVALYIRKNGVWLGKTPQRIRRTTDLILAMDHYEQRIDGNGDTFFKWTQWVNPDRSNELLRHNNNRDANVLFLDCHVAPMNRQELSNESYYTGRW